MAAAAPNNPQGLEKASISPDINRVHPPPTLRGHMGGSRPEPVFSTLTGPLRAIGSVVLPGPDALDEEGWRRAEAIMEHAVAPRPASVKRQLRLFLRLVNLLPLFRTGRTLSRLPPARRAAFLRRLERSKLTLLRRGLWGVRTLLFMGYYTQESVRKRIGYRASPGGWSSREEGGGASAPGLAAEPRGDGKPDAEASS